MSPAKYRKPLGWLYGEIKTPPFSLAARIEAGTLLGRLQDGESIGMPHSRPMPSVGKRCHELQIPDENRSWRIMINGDLVMDARKKARLEAAGFKFGDAGDFLELSDAERAVVEMRVSLARRLREKRVKAHLS